MEYFIRRAGIEATHVPFTGAAPAINDLVAGHVDVYMASLPLSANALFMTLMATKMPFVGRG